MLCLLIKTTFQKYSISFIRLKFNHIVFYCCRRYFADRIVKFLFFAFLAWWLYSNCHIITSSIEILDNTFKSLPPISQVKADGSVEIDEVHTL